MCILDLSKVLMCKFHHDYSDDKHGNNSRLLFTGTDSLIYEMKNKDVYEGFTNDKKIFNFILLSQNIIIKTN